MTRMREVAYAELTPDHKNANAGTKRGRDLHQRSLEKLGAARSIVLDRDGRVVAGNKTLEVAAELGIPVVEIESDGEVLYAVKRKDWDLTDDHGDARAYAYADNRVSEENYALNLDVLLADAESGVDSIHDYWFPEELSALGVDGITEEEGDEALPDDAGEEEQPERPSYRFKTGDTITLGVHRLIVGDMAHDEVQFLMEQWQGFTGFQAQIIPG